MCGKEGYITRLESQLEDYQAKNNKLERDLKVSNFLFYFVCIVVVITHLWK